MENKNEFYKQQFLKTLSNLSKLANIEINELIIEAYSEHLSKDWEAALKALNAFFKENFYRPRLPSPFELTGRKPAFKLQQERAADEAEIIVSKIEESFSMFGWPNPNEARHYIGDIGWSVVGHRWKELCSQASDSLRYEKPHWRKVIAGRLGKKYEEEQEEAEREELEYHEEQKRIEERSLENEL